MLSITAIPALPGTCSCPRIPQSGGRGLRVTDYRANAGYRCAALTQSPSPPLPIPARALSVLLGLHNRGIGPAEHAARVPAGARKRCPKAEAGWCPRAGPGGASMLGFSLITTLPWTYVNLRTPDTAGRIVQNMRSGISHLSLMLRWPVLCYPEVEPARGWSRPHAT